VFILPAGYRPAEREVFAVVTTDGMSATMPPNGSAVEVSAAGEVFVYAQDDDRYVSMSGISFSAAP